MSYLLRIVLPDRPGALGAVATALGAVGADILSLDVIERSPGMRHRRHRRRAPAGQAGRLASCRPRRRSRACRSSRSGRTPDRSTRTASSNCSTSWLAGRPAQPFEVLADGVTRIFRAGLGPRPRPARRRQARSRPCRRRSRARARRRRRAVVAADTGPSARPVARAGRRRTGSDSAPSLRSHRSVTARCCSGARRCAGCLRTPAPAALRRPRRDCHDSSIGD